MIVRSLCSICGEDWHKRHAGGFISGHRAYHEFEREQYIRIDQMGGNGNRNNQGVKNR